MTDQTPSIEVVEQEPEEPHVVVGIDGSAGARAALLFALHDAARRGVPVEALGTYQPPDYWLDFYAMGISGPDQARAAAVDRVREFVAAVLPEGPQPPPPVRVRVRRGSAADALVQASQHAVLLVVGSRGHGGFASMLLGSVSMQCVVHSVCPVTVVHSPEARRERLHLRRSRHVGAAAGGLPLA